MTAGLRELPALRVGVDGAAEPRREWIAEETPVALLYNGMAFAVMMATPSNLEDFALGFALGEGVVAAAEEFALVDVVRSDDGIALHAAIPQRRFDALEGRRRALEGRSGCGLCGIASLRAARATVEPVGAETMRIGADRIARGLDALAARQPLNARSGGVHAAGFVRVDLREDEAPLVREDVGRHNALDKTIGALARDGGFAPDRGFVAITSRASFEIVQKAMRARIPLVAAISAPTALAIELAEQAGITLVAFARGGAMNVYAHPQRVA